MNVHRLVLAMGLLAISHNFLAAQEQVAEPLHLEPIAVLGDQRLRHAGSITHIAPLADGRRALTTARDGSVRLWDLTTGKETRRFHQDRGEDVWNVMLLPGEQEFLSCGEDKQVTRWNIATGEAVASYKLPSTGMRLAMVPGGKQFIACDSGQRPSLWDLATEKRVRAFQGHGDAVYSAFVTPDAKLLVTCGEDGSIRAWHMETGKAAWTIAKVEEEAEAGADPFEGGDIDPFGAADDLDDLFGEEEIIVIEEIEEELVIDDLFGEPELPVPADDAPNDEGAEKKPRGPGHTADVFTICPLPGGERFASCSSDHHVALWNTADGSPVWKVELPESLTVISASPDGAQLAVTCGDSHIYVLRTSDGKRLQKIKLPGGRHWPVCFSPDGKQLLSGGDHTIYRWDTSTGKRLFPPADSKFAIGAIEEIAVSPDGTRVYAIDESDAVHIWDARKGLRVGGWKGPREIEFFELSPDGTQAILRAEDQIAVVDAATGKREVEVNLNNSIRHLAVANGGKIVLGSGWDRELKAWNTVDGGLRYAIKPEDEGNDFDRFVVSHDGQQVFIIGEQFVEVRKVADGKLVAKFANNLGDDVGAATILIEDRALLLFSDDRDNRQLAMFVPPALPHAQPISIEAIRKLSSQLGDEDFSTRERAMHELIRSGDRVLPVLNKVALDDSEVRWRVAKIRDGVRDGTIPLKALPKAEMPREARTVLAHPCVPCWAAITGYDCRASVSLGRFAEGRTEFGEAVADGHSPAALAFAPDGKTLYTGNRDGTVSVYAVKPRD